jgi:CubicO group peptidase (beta-lactamase class C family)
MFVTRSAAAAAAGLACHRAAEQQGQAPSPQSKLDVDGMLEVARGVPGVAAAGVIDTRPVEFYNGVKRSGDSSSIAANTTFPAASLSKAVFAWAVRDLVKQGKLDWTRPLEDYARLGLAGDARRITAEQVLSHTSGLPNWIFDPSKSLELQYPVGSRWRYSGEGFVLLQRVVEAIAGAPIAAYMKTAVLEPLGLTSSTYAWSPELQNQASGHDDSGLVMEKSLRFYDESNYQVLAKAGLSPEAARYDQIIAAYRQSGKAPLNIAIQPNVAGSLQTTAADYARFLERVLADVAVRPDDYRPRIAVNKRISWTLGLGVDRSLGTPAFFHMGDGPGFKNLAWVEPERKTALVILTNGERGIRLYSWLLRSLLREDPAALYWV